jgi:hypothetical protein
MPPSVRAAVTGSTNVKIAGAIGVDYWRGLANLINLKREDLEPLRKGEFFLRFGRGNPTVNFKTRSEFAGKNHNMTDAQLQRVKAFQLARYYRPIEPLKDTLPPVEIILPERAERHPAAPRTMEGPVKDIDGDMDAAPW